MSQFKNSVCRGFGERDDDLKQKKNLQKKQPIYCGQTKR